MKKTLVFAAAALLVLCAPGLSGCGGDAGRAGEMIQLADSTWKDLSDRLNSAVERSAALVTTVLTGRETVVDAGTLTVDSQLMEDLLPEFAALRESYAEVGELKGVAGYSRYADTMIEAVSATESAAVASAGFFSRLVEPLASGDTAYLNSVIGKSLPELDSLLELQEKANGALAEAGRIRSEERISP